MGVLWLIGLLALGRLGQAVDPCQSYNTLNDVFRSVGYTVRQMSDQLVCDRLLADGWYRFTSQAGGQLPTTCVPVNHCGTHVPFWMQGSLPKQADGVVNRKACGHYGGDCCSDSVNIQVKNCGGYFVYFLKPLPACSMAYCAGTRVPCGRDETSATGFQPCTAAYPKLPKEPTLSNPIVSTNTFKFGCHVDFDPQQTNVGFEITWLFNGKADTTGQVPKTQVTGINRDAYLDQKYLKGHLGKELSCSAKSYFLNSPHLKGPAYVSNNYWVGIQISPGRLTVGENDKPQTVKIISTIPVICNQANQATCRLDMYLDSNNHDASQTKKCTQTLLPKDWNPVSNTAETSFQVLAQRDFKNDKDKILQMHFQEIRNPDAPQSFLHYNIPYLQVTTKDKQTSICSCTGDPHCYTFDQQLAAHGGRAHHYNYYKVGEFTLYKSTAREFEVQVRTWRCWKVTCNCAVAAREGNDIVTIDMCHSAWGKSYPKMTVEHKGHMSQGTVVYKHPSGREWLIYFPSGAWVRVINGGGKYLNVYVQAPEDDFGATQGLCGTFDQNTVNDLTLKDGTVLPWSGRPDRFIESWRVPLKTSFFDRIPPLDPKLNNDLYYCNCAPNGVVDCRITNKATRPAIHSRCSGCHAVVQGGQTGTGRKKRAVQAAKVDTDTPVALPFDYGLFDFSAPYVPTWPTASGMTEAQATSHCRRGIDSNPTIRQCISRAGMNFDDQIDMCVEDLKISDSLEFISSALDAAIMSCMEVVLKEPGFYDNSTGLPPAFITTDLCSGQCSGNGVCNHGTCTCHAGFTGQDCAIDTRAPPAIWEVIGGQVCDLEKRPCKKIFVSGNNMMQSTSFRCRLKLLSFADNRFTPRNIVLEEAAEHMSINHVGCHMPSLAATHGQAILGYEISLTNDRHLYSNTTQTVIIVDSQCMTCTATGACTVKADKCVISGQCYAANAHHSVSSHLYCDPTKSQSSWSGVTTTESTTASTTKSTAASTTKSTAAPTTKSTAAPTTKSTTAPTTKSTTAPTTKSTTAPTTKSTAAPTTPATPMTTLPTAPLGGIAPLRVDIWTHSATGCPCKFDLQRMDCACCDEGACQCPSGHHNQCVQCNSSSIDAAECGKPKPGPDYGVDGYTVALSDCACKFDTSKANCACCQNGGCQCDRSQKNQCVLCGHMDRCGKKPWIYGPPTH